MQLLIALINKDVAKSMALIAHRYAPDFQISHMPGHYFMLNSNLLLKTLSHEPTIVSTLAEGMEAFDLVSRKSVDISSADPATCIIQIKVGKV